MEVPAAARVAAAGMAAKADDEDDDDDDGALLLRVMLVALHRLLEAGKEGDEGCTEKEPQRVFGATERKADMQRGAMAAPKRSCTSRKLFMLVVVRIESLCYL